MMRKRSIVKKVVLLAIALYVFLLSIKLMGGAFTLFGADFATELISFTTNPLVGLFVGILATSLVQSSSVTTSVLVGLVASGALTIGSAIPIILGANIGTSITNTIVALAHITNKDEFRRAFEVATIHDFFNLLAVIVIFPLELQFHFLQNAATYLTQFFLGTSGVQFSSPLDLIIKPAASAIQSFLGNDPIVILVVALLAIFMSLRMFVTLMKPLAESKFKDLLHQHVFSNPLRSFSLGVILTGIAQSSSVTTSLIVPLAGMSIVTLERIFPYLLGANVGTTFTAMMAALVTGSPAAITVAIVHVLFNVLGSALIWPIRKIPEKMSISMAKFSLRSRAIPIGYITFAFYILPIVVIIGFR